MAHKYLLDTHALIWFVEGNKRLGESAKTIIAAPNSEMVLPLIALWLKRPLSLNEVGRP